MKKCYVKQFFADFKKFATKGNIVDLAVAVVVGGAFGKIVTSLVNDIIMPLISAVIGGANVRDWKWVIKEATYNAEGVLLTAETALTYGNFIQAIIDFLIIAFFIFLALRMLMRVKEGFEAAKTFNEKQLKKLLKKGVSEEEIKKMQEPPVAEPPKETTESLLKEIRDLLIRQQAADEHTSTEE